VRPRRPSPATIVALAALVLAMGGLSLAAIPGPAGVIRGCYSKKTGALRVLQRGTRCARGERKVSWSEKGRPGDPGARGATGAQGIQGAQGPQGTNGTNGANGANGTARAYASVLVTDTDPAFQPGHVKNFVSVTRPSADVYCLTPSAGIDLATTAPVASVNEGESGGALNTLFVGVETSTSSCSSGQFEVRTQGPSPNSVAFTIVVP
jgi:hypothetical protein